MSRNGPLVQYSVYKKEKSLDLTSSSLNMTQATSIFQESLCSQATTQKPTKLTAWILNSLLQLLNSNCKMEKKFQCNNIFSIDTKSSSMISSPCSMWTIGELDKKLTFQHLSVTMQVFLKVLLKMLTRWDRFRVTKLQVPR